VNLVQIGQTLSVTFVPLILAITLHEAAHGWVAEKLGDDTAEMMGRVTLNPLRHIDPFGTIVLPLLLALGSHGTIFFGYAKPVPVAFHRLNNPKRDMVWVALAGPGINLGMAFLAAMFMHPLLPLTGYTGGVVAAGHVVADWIWENLKYFWIINVSLAVFNMLPIPPLDGGRVLTGLLPGRIAFRYAQVERYGLLIVMLLMVSPMLISGFNPLAMVLSPAIDGVFNVVAFLTGWA
jgi:Zn-dependent protease